MNDLDLMLLADGEADPSTAGLTPSTAERVKIEGIREVGALVRGHLELSTDDAEARLAGLWDLVERRIDADERAAQPAAVPAAVEDPGVWARFTGWMGRYRSQVLTGMATAGAAAVLTLVLRPGPTTVTKTVYLPGDDAIDVRGVPGPGPGPAAQIMVGSPTEIESLEVSGGTGAVFTIEDEDDGDTTVIWVTPDDVVEGL